jgi:hypothetical protein
VLRQVAEGVLIHESEFCQSNAVVVLGQAGVLLIDPGVLGYEMAALANDLGQSRTTSSMTPRSPVGAHPMTFTQPRVLSTGAVSQDVC